MDKIRLGLVLLAAMTVGGLKGMGTALEFVAPPVEGHVHASTVLPVKGGYLAAWFEGVRESAGDVAIWGAARRDGKWDGKRLLAKVNPESAHWNPVLRRGDDGRVCLYFKVGRNCADWRTYVIESLDDGVTWSSPRELVPGDVMGGRGPVKNKCLRLKSGRWIAGASREFDPAKLDLTVLWRAFADISDDDGRTWRKTEPFPIPADAPMWGRRPFGVIQPTLWEDADGVHALMRATDGWIWRTDSKDEGETWSVCYRSPLENINSGIDCARTSDGRLFLALNGVNRDPKQKGWGSRNHLEIKVSSDGGSSWTTFQTLADDQLVQGDGRASEFSYPALMEARPGLLVLTFTYNRRQIAFCEIDVSARAAAEPLFRPGDRVAWIGDSITSAGHRTPTGYITTLERAADETQTPGFDNVIGLGFAGWHVYAWQGYERKSLQQPDLPSRFDRVPTMGEVFTNRLDVIVIALGINDHGLPTFPDDDIARWEREYDKMISNLKERCHPRKFVLCSMTAHTCDPTAAANRRLERMNRLIAALATRHDALYVDFWTPAWRTIDRVRRMKTGLRDLQDLIHPGPVGNAEMAVAFAKAVGVPEPMLRNLENERERRYAKLAASLGPTPRLVCQLWPDKAANTWGARAFSYDIPWNLVGATAGEVKLDLPTGWKGSVERFSASNGVAHVQGETLHLANSVRLTADLPNGSVSETVSIPAPWFVSRDFAFPSAWKGVSWQKEAVPPVGLSDVKEWTAYTSTWNFSGDVDPGAIDLRSVNTGFPNGAAYVRRVLSLPRAMRLTLKVGTTFWSARNGLRIWCDGRIVGETLLDSGWKDGTSYVCEDRSFVLDLPLGRHDLVILTANERFDHYFHVKIQDAKTGNTPEDVVVEL